jgi:glycosyltransferase involved in cell wall biosynthesis
MFYTWNPFLQHRLRDIPSVIAVHDPYPHPGLVDALYRQLENWSIHQAKRCLVFSQNLAPALQRRGAPLDKIDVIPMGEFNIYAQPSTSRPMTQPALKPLLLFFGRITAYKGIEVLLRAYLEVRRTHPAHLQIVGAGDLRPYQTLLDQTPEVQVVNRWIDEQEIAHHFQQATLILLPYTSATQSGVLPIAASFARPVIATRTGGIPEQIIEGKTGLLVEPNSPGQLAQAIRSLLDDPGFARQLGNNLHTDYQLNRSWDQIAARVLMSCDKVYK